MSLVGHCIDVAAVFMALLELPTMRRRLDALAGRVLTERDLSRLAVLAFLHDVGKAGAGFYSKALVQEPSGPWAARLPRDQQGHTHVVLALGKVPELEAHRQALDYASWSVWWPQATDLWLAAVSHHGRPIRVSDFNVGQQWTTWTATVHDYVPLQGLARLGQAAHRLWPQAFDVAPGEPLAAPLIHAFAGLVSLADWIGSNTDFFPYSLSGSQDETRWEDALDAAQRALKSIGLDLRTQREQLAANPPTFQALFDVPAPRPMQAAAATRLDQPLVVLEAETGSGKTEAAFWRFVHLFMKGEVDSLCMLLPTRVAASGIYERLEAFVCRAFPDPASRPPWVLAVPGDLRANGVQGERQPGLPWPRVLWNDFVDPDDRFWAAENSKRYFAAGLVAGTIDQFLLTALRTGHAHLRGALTLRSLVVVDEVHASDPYMGRLLSHALARHAAAGGHAMLLSATLTGAARQALMAAGQPPRRNRYGRPLPVPADWARPDAPYPCLSSAMGLDDLDPGGREEAPTKRVQCTALAAMGKPAEVAARAAAAVAAGQRVLVLRNTVGQALATQRALEHLLGLDHPALFRCNGQPVLHHGRYARPDRLQLDLEVARRFGKDAAKDGTPVVLVGTQTLEISVDCDADLLITDIVPMDVLLQRLGRLHRHAARHPVRPGGHTLAQAVVLAPPCRELAQLFSPAGRRGLGLGKNSAYPNLLSIEATWRQLERNEVWDIPHHNRRLVEACCDVGTLFALADALGGGWPAHRDEIYGAEAAKRTAAEFARLDWLQPWEAATPGELSSEARTRLGLDAVRVEMRRWQSPLGQEITSLDIPAWMWAGIPDDLSAEAMDPPKDGELLFAVGGQRFRYGRFGLERDD